MKKKYSYIEDQYGRVKAKEKVAFMLQCKAGDFFKFDMTKITKSFLVNNGFHLVEDIDIAQVVWKVDDTGHLRTTSNNDVLLRIIWPHNIHFRMILPCSQCFGTILNAEEKSRIEQRKNWFRLYKSLDISGHDRTTIFR